MRRHFILYIKRQKTTLLLLACFFFTGISVRAQVCDGEFYFDVNPTSVLCEEGFITIRAELLYAMPGISGEFRWYTSPTSTDVKYRSPCSGDGSSSEYTMYATNGATIYVCVYNPELACETPRVSYSVSVGTPLTAYLGFAQVCRDNIGDVHLVTTGSSYMELQKFVNGAYEYVATSYDGYFSVPDPGTNRYRVWVYGNCSNPMSLDFLFQFYDQAAPVVTGNATICEGQSTILTATGTQNKFWWYNQYGDIVYEGAQFATPTYLKPGTYTYTARGGNNDNCTGYGTSITITVMPSPSISGGSSCIEGRTLQLTSTLAGGTWSSSNPWVASINANGLITGKEPGTATITYTFTSACGTISTPLNVTVLPLSSLYPGLGIGIEDMPNTSIIPLVNNGIPVVTKYAPVGDQSLVHTIKNVLAFQVLEENRNYIPGDFTATVLLKIEYGHAESNLCVKNDLELTVNYTKGAGLKYDALNYFAFENAEFTRVTVLNVNMPTMVNGVAFNTADVLKLTNTLLYTRYYQLADNKKPDLTVVTPASGAVPDALHVSWTIPANTNNNGVQLEWAWLEQGMEDDYKNSNNVFDPNLLFKAGATRIDLAEGASGGSYDIPLLYDGTGSLYIRARAINIMPSGSRSDGPWSDMKSFAFAGHEDKLNWQVTTSYAEEGKRKSVIQYFDGTLRPRQTVTKDNTTGKTVVTETMYDMEGRPAVQILPAPGIDNIISYRENLNKFNGQADNSNPADYFDFTTNTSGVYATTPLDERYGTANYYSAQNPERNAGIHQNIPAANGYPYSVTRFMPDGTGRIMRQSSPGNAHKMESGHETLYFYGTPEQEELDALFGTEVGEKSHYFKNMVQDANGQMNVSYLDMQGRTIATALAGESTLAALPGSGLSPYEDHTRNLLSKETNLLKGNSIEAVSSILVPYSTTYGFTYKLNKQTITVPTCNNTTVTYDCKFDLQIAVTDETGERSPYIFNRTAIDQVDLYEPLTLAGGSYSVRKTLTINQAWLQSLVDQYGADGVGVCSTLAQLVNTIMAEDIQNSGCNLPVTPLTSSDCRAVLGDLNAYKSRYAASINVVVANLTPAQVNDISVQYDADVAFCMALDPAKSNTLVTIRQQMLGDMVPFTGQYADVNKSGLMFNRYNIFSTTGGAFSPQPYYKNPHNESTAGNNYYNDYGSVDPSGTAAILQGMTTEEFGSAFKASWATALLPYHPEFNKLKFAEDNLRSSFDFIDNLQANTTVIDAINADPFFSRAEQAGNKNTIMGYSNATWPAAGNLSMWKLAYGDALGCKTFMNTNDRSTCYSNMPVQFTATGTSINTGFVTVTVTDAMQAQAWTVYKAMYAQVRNEMVSTYINEAGRGSNNELLINEGYRLHFPANMTEAARSNATASSGNEWASLIPNAQGTYPTVDYQQAAATYGHPCDSYINMWRQALLDCPQLASRSDKEEILTTITTRMLEVCRNGTDGANSYGAATVAPAYSGGANTSFEQVILTVFQSKGITVNEFCHPYGIEFPKPYGMNPPVAKPTTATVETCTCTQWSKLLLEMAQAGYSSNTLAAINQYVSAVYHETITPELYAGLLKCGQSYQVCTGTQDPDPCTECRVAASNPGNSTCVTITSIPLLSPQPLPAFLVCGFDKNIAKCFNCTAFVNLQTSFNTIFGQTPVMSGTVPDNKIAWNDLFAKYVNYKTGLQHNWLYYASRFNVNSCPVGGIGGVASNSDLSICREDKPLNDAPVDNPPSPCDAIRAGSILKATLQYEYLKRQVMDNFRAAYIEKCTATMERFTVNYAPKEYHYTLFYYDRAGNLVKTVPPKGVQPNYTKAFLDGVVAEREKMKNGLPYTEKPVDHTLETRYLYNSLNKAVLKKTPDAGSSKFWYDQIGRQVVSQNAKQAAVGNVYSYTKFDELGRVVLTAQLTSSTALTDAVAKEEITLGNWYNNAYNSQKQVIQTVYDEGYTVIDGYMFNQNNLRNRVAYTRVWNNIGDPYAAAATYYSYDIYGNADGLLQDFGNANGVTNFMNQSGNRFKKIKYAYDLISGKVTKVSYQPGEIDAYYHQYAYDGENRLTDVYSGRDEVMLKLFPEREAHYDNYRHGPLASTTLGQLMVQKQNYAYTLNSKLKAVNPAFGGTLANGTTTTEAFPVTQDAYGFSLHYFNNDYEAIGYTGQNGSILASLGTDAVSMYNGNIAAIAVNIPKLGAPKVYNYHYDQLNRLVAMDAYNGLNISTRSFTPGTALNEYQERIGYDPNGNILSYLRNGDVARQSMDNLTYHYTPNTNQLHKVVDQAPDQAANYSNYNDIKTNQSDDNYVYDLTGNLVKDKIENIDITWNVYGKIATISKPGAVTNFAYDATNNRILKITASGATAYVRDGDGNVLSVYTKQANGNALQTELHLYGSKRLGIAAAPRVSDAVVVLGCGFANGIKRTFTRGEKLFELSNHLGNVLVTVTDKRLAVAQAGNSALIDHYEADIASAQDYYPFGMIQPGRRFNAGGYRYGFNGKENDNDVKGEGSQQDYGMRIYDPRLGKFLSVDPITDEYPELTPYQFASNRPIDGIDLDGLEFCGTPEQEKKYAQQKALQKLIQILPPPSKDMLQVMDPGRQHILTKDFYNRTIIGERREVERVINAQRVSYNQAVGDNIRGGLFGAAGYWFGGARGSFVGSFFDQSSVALAGIPGRGYMSRPNSNVQRQWGANTEAVTQAKVYSYRALNELNRQTLYDGQGVFGKNPNGTWNLEQHLIQGSSKAAYLNDPWVSTSLLYPIAQAFNTGNGIIRIDLSKVPVSSAQFGFKVLPRFSRGYHYSVWQQEVSVSPKVPVEAISIMYPIQ